VRCVRGEASYAPSVNTVAVSDITSTTATSGGNITSDGGSMVTAKGICWNTSHDPTTADSKTTNGTGTGSFTSNLTGLVANTTYYVRAYATNSVGSAYGNEVSFISLASDSPTYPGTSLSAVKIGDIWWAPVNSGYNQTTLTHGLLYQWHRKYGQDYNNSGITSGPVSLEVGNNSNNSNLIYVNITSWDWCTTNQIVWNMTPEYNPCPSGWRVPSATELNTLENAGYSYTNSGIDGLTGKWFGGNYATNHIGSLFLPISGNRSGTSGISENRGIWGYYWSSSSFGMSAQGLFFNNGLTSMGTSGKQSGFSVRCVKDSS